MAAFGESKTMRIAELKLGVYLLRFLDVPEKFQRMQADTIAFLRKFDFSNLTVRRGAEHKLIDADELIPGDRVLTFGRLAAPVMIAKQEHLNVLIKVGFQQVLVVEPVRAQQPAANTSFTLAVPAQAPWAKVEPPKPRPKAPSVVLEPIAVEPPPNEPSLKRKNDAGDLHQIQDNLSWAKRLAKESNQILEELYESNFINKEAVQATDQLSVEMAKLVEANPHAGNVRSLLKDEDEYTYHHSIDVAQYVISVCHLMQGYGGKQLASVAVGGLLHDIGKSKLPKNLLKKQTKFTPQEKELMRQHPQLGAQILSDLGYTDLQIDIAKHHHVLRQGGYPRQDYDKISNLARLTGVADIYQALTTKRPYKTTEVPGSALQTLLKLSKTQIDPRLVILFIKSVGVYPIGSTLRLKSGEIAFVVGKGTNTARPQIVPVIDKQGKQILHHQLIDLSDPEFAALTVDQPVDHREYFANEALDIFQNLSVL